MNAEQARNRAKKTTVKSLMKGIYDMIGRASDEGRYSIATPLPVEEEQIVLELRSKGFRAIKASSTHFRIDWSI